MSLPSLTPKIQKNIEKAAILIQEADGILITAGAGMGVDSGLPDFRGRAGFWNEYPALKEANIDFSSIANGSEFQKKPRRAWGFYGHRLALYRSTVPHLGFELLKDIGSKKTNGYFVVTSNVDGQFQKAQYDPNMIFEVHGTIHHLQCAYACRDQTWPATDLQPNIDTNTCEWVGNLPSCPYCKRPARPNILMFDDYFFSSLRKEIQKNNFEVWRSRVEKLVVIECGAGTDIPTIRYFGEAQKSPLIRINMARYNVSQSAGVPLPLRCLEGIKAIHNQLYHNN